VLAENMGFYYICDRCLPAVLLKFILKKAVLDQLDSLWPVQMIYSYRMEFSQLTAQGLKL
jgi:hypothetical protein